MGYKAAGEVGNAKEKDMSTHLLLDPLGSFFRSLARIIRSIRLAHIIDPSARRT